MTKKDKKQLRSGYTTGACAAAVSKAATLALLSQTTVEEIQISLPVGERVNFTVHHCVFDNLQASCLVIKDAGDDPDVTDGAEIWATVSWKNEAGITLKGGRGVGTVTKLGLEVAVGMPAINPVPRKMVLEAIRELPMPENKGLEITVSVPRGEELAKKTLNRRLGIVGGISILGTTGIVVPYSVEAYKACISQALDVAVASKCQEAVLTTGRRSEKFAQRELKLPEEAFIQMGDFVDYALRECAKRKLAKVSLWGMVGKISKLANGHFYTHISSSEVDINFLSKVALNCGVSGLRGARSAHQFLEMLPPSYAREVCNKLCLLAALRCREYAGNIFEMECVMTDYDGIILGRACV
jgi:cobalt-precorrin-5B (C1)-methyltransferase